MNVTELGQNMLNEHHCHGWKCYLSEDINEVEIMLDGFHTLARTNFTQRTITLDLLLLERPEGEIREAILHEIAHVLAGHKAGHGERWSRTAEKIGVSPQHLIAHMLVQVQMERLGTGCRSRRRNRNCAPRASHLALRQE
jgi:hypothetical protein